MAPFVAFLAACSGSQAAPDFGPAPSVAPAAPVAKTEDQVNQINPRLLRRFRQLRAHVVEGDTNVAKVELGKSLFFDARMSRNHEVSCNTCHELGRRGVDGRPTSKGVTGKAGKRNAPTVFNAAGHIGQFWDGRAADLVEQAGGPILDPDEMGMLSPAAVEAELHAIPGYGPMFARAFPTERQPITFKHAREALAEFERTLVTPSRWDRYLAGDQDALTHDEIAGLKVFADIGCVQCHTGELVGGSMFQRVGVAEPWPNQRDAGRYEVTKLETDRMVFKVPSLRNVTKTAPFFHDGSVSSLPVAVQMMAKHQLGLELTADETRSIVDWLGALEGDAPRVEPPVLPPDAPTASSKWTMN